MLPAVRLPELRPLRAWWNSKGDPALRAGAPGPEAEGKKLQEATGCLEARTVRKPSMISDIRSEGWECRSGKIQILTYICCHFNTSR